MATDYETYDRLKAKAKAKFIRALLYGEEWERHQAASDAFEIIHASRGYALALHSDFPLGITDDDVNDWVVKLEAIVGPAYPQKE